MNEQSLFIEALEMHDPAERAAFLDQVCASDPALRRRLERLLQRHQQADSFLDDPFRALSVTIDAPISERPGTRIGPYKLLEQIGEGSFGIVFMAEQMQPVRRKVALKILKPGMDTRIVVARFEAERQALAIMDHPHIAKIHDGGATPSGRPYFVMELVKGVPITDFCDQNQLTPQQRLELFLPVCQAVQHAHQKGIIHRDLKPSNVLVSRHDTTPVVKVIDFGVAKALGQELTDKTLFTGIAQMIGTPLYMSPEQAGMSDLDVDTRSDIYSLCVLLYELLTGTTPFDKERLRTAGYEEIRRMIREEEAPKPSTRISTLGQAAATVSANRQSNPKKLGQLMHGELNWIVMKALEKDRNRRYDTAIGLARDIERYLHDEPVQACPPSAWYRFRKFARRHKGPMLAASLVVLALAAGSIGTIVGLIQAEKARQREAGLRRIAEDNEKMAKEREAETRAVLEFLERNVLAAARPEGQHGGLGRDATLRKTIEAALPLAEKRFPDQPLIEARLRMTLARSFGNLGEAKLAADQAERAWTIYSRHLGTDHPDTLASMLNLANGYYALGRHADALKLREETLVLMKTKLGPDHPHTLSTMNNLALSYVTLGQHNEALKLYEETLALKKTKLGPDHPSTLGSMNNLALNYMALGRHADALKLGQEALRLYKATLGPDNPRTLGSLDTLAVIYHDLGRHDEAVQLYEETLALMKVKLGPDHPTALSTMHNLAGSYAAVGRHGAEFKLREETLALRKAKLGPDHPYTLASMGALARLLATCPDVKIRNPSRGVELAKQAVERAPNGNFWNTLGIAFYRAGD
jgi:serine/threonine protein kinase/tetratricopeptide (TPR) repeat protein